MFVPIAAVALLFPCQVANAPLAGWKDFNPKDGGFVVKMPGDPREKSQTIETSDGPAKLTHYGVTRDGIAYIVMISELTPGAVERGPQSILDEARDKGVKNSGGTLKSEKKIVLNGHPGREMVLELPDSKVHGGGTYRSRVYLAGRIHYQVTTLSPKSKERPAEMKAFLESFRLKDKKSDP